MPNEIAKQFSNVRQNDEGRLDQTRRSKTKIEGGKMRRRSPGKFAIKIEGEPTNDAHLGSCTMEFSAPIEDGLIYLILETEDGEYQIGFPAGIAFDLCAEIIDMARAVSDHETDSGVWEGSRDVCRQRRRALAAIVAPGPSMQTLLCLFAFRDACLAPSGSGSRCRASARPWRFDRRALRLART